MSAKLEEILAKLQRAGCRLFVVHLSEDGQWRLSLNMKGQVCSVETVEGLEPKQFWEKLIYGEELEQRNEFHVSGTISFATATRLYLIGSRNLAPNPMILRGVFIEAQEPDYPVSGAPIAH